MIYSVWEQIDPLLLERPESRLPFLSVRLIRDLRRDFWCIHAHTYQHTALSLVSAPPQASGRGAVPLQTRLSDSVFMSLAGEPRGVLSFSLGITALLMKHLLMSETFRGNPPGP